MLAGGKTGEAEWSHAILRLAVKLDLRAARIRINTQLPGDNRRRCRRHAVLAFFLARLLLIFWRHRHCRSFFGRWWRRDLGRGWCWSRGLCLDRCCCLWRRRLLGRRSLGYLVGRVVLFRVFGRVQVIGNGANDDQNHRDRAGNGIHEQLRRSLPDLSDGLLGYDTRRSFRLRRGGILEDDSFGLYGLDRLRCFRNRMRWWRLRRHVNLFQWGQLINVRKAGPFCCRMMALIYHWIDSDFRSRDFFFGGD